MAVQSSPILAGRLGSPTMMLKDDPRADPRMLAAIAPYALGETPQPAGVDASSSLDEILKYAAASEAGFEGLTNALFADLVPVQGVAKSIEVIKGGDDNDVTVFVHRPAKADGTLPGILHLHGGAMAVLEAAGKGYDRWRDELAAAGLVVAGIEFRNAAGKHGNHPFPAGLNDCMAGLQWMNDHKDRLGISKVVVSGESGGGNLSLATALKAKREGRLDAIDGVYAQCPYISNAYATKDPALPSLYENDEYFMACDMMGALAKAYDPSGDNATNPLAWPYHATVEELRGLPPHVISVNQLDPLRDEGLAYYRKLLDAGVRAVSRTVNGTCHAGDCLFLAAMPDVYLATIRDIKGFADSL